MREIKVRTPKGMGNAVADLALTMGAGSATINTAVDASSQQENDEIKIKTSTPTARAFINALLHTPFYDAKRFTVSSHDIRSLSSSDDVAAITKPFCMPFMDIYQDLWQSSHVTGSFICRAVISAMLLAYAMLRGQFVLMVGAMLFTVFSPTLMAIGFGTTTSDSRFVIQAAKAFLWANVLSIAASVLTTWVAKGPLLWNDFGSFPSNVFISVCAAVVGAVADADDAGRRQLIAIAAAFPYSRFPPWIGICLVLGFPGWRETGHQLIIFTANVVTMILCSGLTYAALGLRSPRIRGIHRS